jgi:hypothetical protein
VGDQIALRALFRGGICIDIEKAGHTLLEVWSRFKEDRASDGSMITPEPFDDAVREWKAVKLGKGVSQRYVDEAEQVFNRFAEGRTKEFVHRFTHLDLTFVSVFNPGRRIGPLTN